MRMLQANLKTFIDAKLMSNGLARLAVKNKDARALLVEAARVCVGEVYEATGKNDGPMVALFQKTVDGKASGEPWCMCFVQTMIAYVESKLQISSPLIGTESCLDLWNSTSQSQRVQFHPLAGAIAIWEHGNTGKGHTGILLDCDEANFHAVEGNTTGGTDPAGKIIRDGGGVHYTFRSRAGNGDMRLRGFIKPF